MQYKQEARIAGRQQLHIFKSLWNIGNLGLDALPTIGRLLYSAFLRVDFFYIWFKSQFYIFISIDIFDTCSVFHFTEGLFFPTLPTFSSSRQHHLLLCLFLLLEKHRDQKDFNFHLFLFFWEANEIVDYKRQTSALVGF